MCCEARLKKRKTLKKRERENGNFLFDHSRHSAMCLTVLLSQEERGLLLLLHRSPVSAQSLGKVMWQLGFSRGAESAEWGERDGLETKRAQATAGSWAGARGEFCVDPESTGRCVKGRKTAGCVTVGSRGHGS